MDGDDKQEEPSAVGLSVVDSTPLQKFLSNARSTFCELRQSGQLCDVTIKVDCHAFPCHRVILSACSPYFKALFTNELSPSTRCSDVVLSGLTVDTMKIILDFAYELTCNITADNVEQILPAADQFEVTGLIKSCCDFLDAEINYENCIGIYQFARTYFCHQLSDKAFKFLLQHFCQIYVVSNEYLQLSTNEVCAVLGANELNVKNEEIVFEAALRWIAYDTEVRKHCIVDLLHTMRLGLLAKQYFVEKVKTHPFVKENDACKPIVIETIKFLYDLDMDEEKEIDIRNPLARPRVPHDIMFAIGGWSGGSPTNIIETYDTRADRWITVDSVDNGPRAYHGTQCIDMKIYIIGGFDGVEYFNSVRSFDPTTKIWTEVAPMYAKRCYISTAVLEGYVYAMGGYDGQNRQNTVERYLPKQNQWSFVHPMNHQRSDASATTLAGKIYICGGFNGQECLSSAEVYDPCANQWTLLPTMRNKRSGVSIMAYKEAIYAVGGFNGMARMNTGEKFTPSTNSWQGIPEMYNPRSNFAIQVIDDMLFVIGGFNGVTTIYDVECYDGSTDEWYYATDMSVYRSALTACVVTSLPNVYDYIRKDRGRTEADSHRKTRSANTPMPPLPSIEATPQVLGE